MNLKSTLDSKILKLKDFDLRNNSLLPLTTIRAPFVGGGGLFYFEYVEIGFLRPVAFLGVYNPSPINYGGPQKPQPKRF